MATAIERTLVGICDEEIPISCITSWQCNKLGGNTDWMCPSGNYPVCLACGDPMYQIVQLYCPLEALPYHRTIYIFTCVRKTCLNRRESWKVFRCQLPVTSPPSEGAKRIIQATPKEVTVATDEWCEDADDWGSDSEENLNEQVSSLATNSSQSEGDTEPLMELQHNQTNSVHKIDFTEQADVAIYNESDGDHTHKDSVAMVTYSLADADLTSCDETLEKITGNVSTEVAIVRESCTLLDNNSLTPLLGQTDVDKMAHHILDERTFDNVDPSDAMKKCSITTQTSDIASSNDSNRRSSSFNPPSFKGYFVSVFDEPSASKLTNHERGLMAEYQQREGVDLLEWQEPSFQMKRVAAGDEVYEKVTAKHGDKVFQRFAKRLQLCPEQCIRYSWNGSPLYLTSPSEGGVIPPCLSCGGQLVFELQLMPGLISMLQDTARPDVIVEFGVVIIYTCKASCWDDPSQPGQSLPREEHVVFQADPDSSLITHATSLV